MGAKQPTLDELAQAMDVNVRTLKGWKARGCPCHSLPAVRQWHANHVLPRKGGPGKKPDARVDSLQLRIMQAEAEKAEEDARGKKMENDRKAGTLMDKQQLVRETAELFVEMRAILESIPDAATKEVPQQYRARIYDVERNKVDGALRKLAAIPLVGSRANGA